jgi:hypothetical protein
VNDFYRIIQNKVEQYASSPENQLEDGRVNWDWVDSDICLDLNMTLECMRDYYQDLFNRAVDNFIAANPDRG